MRQRRRRLFCITKNVCKCRNLHHAHLIGFLCLVSLFTMFLFFHHYDWLPSKLDLKRSSVLPVWWLRQRDSNILRDILTIVGPKTKLLPKGDTGLENRPSSHPHVFHNKLTKPSSPNHFKYIINEAEKCPEKHPFLILLIAVAPGQVEARQAIRRTWGNERLVPDVQILRIFLLGVTSDRDSQLQQSIVKESEQYHDIIQQEYIDTYYNLTIKTLMGMNWVATYCPYTPYVMKTDSDMFVNTEYLIRHLLKPELPPRHKYFTGYLLKGYAPNRNKESKWYMSPELYPGDLYPVFCSGTGYVFSGDLAEKIFEVSFSISHLPLEDVYVGVCLDALGVEPVAPPRKSDFNHWRVSFSDCQYSSLVTSHDLRPGEIIEYWDLVQKAQQNGC